MPSLTIERTCRISPSKVLPLALLALEGLGYERSAGSATEAHLVFRDGSLTSSRFHLYRHMLAVSADGAHLRFQFDSGLTITNVQIDRDELERRVDRVMTEVLPALGPGALPRADRCSVCATPVEPQMTACPMCGIALNR